MLNFIQLLYFHRLCELCYLPNNRLSFNLCQRKIVLVILELLWMAMVGGLEKKNYRKGKDTDAGGQAIEKIIDACLLFEIPVLTLYAFSTENWNRPQSEVTNLMQILREYIEKHASKVIEKDIRFRTLGDISVLDADIYKNLSASNRQKNPKK